MEEKRERLSLNAKGNKSGKKKINMEKVLADIDMGRKRVKDICAEYGICRQTLQRHFIWYKAAHPEDVFLQKRKTLCADKIHPQTKFIDMKRVYELLDSGLSVREVCNIVGCSRTTLYKKHYKYQGMEKNKK